MYLRTTQRRNKDGSIVRYYALAENVRHREKGHVEARVVHSFGRADRLDPSLRSVDNGLNSWRDFRALRATLRERVPTHTLASLGGGATRRWLRH